MSAESGSIWTIEADDRRGQQLPADTTCDVAIVGAGIAGLTIAYLLARKGQNVLVLEAGDRIGGGETEYTSGHLSSAIDDGFARVEQLRGSAFARLAYESHSAAIDTIETICREEQIDCDFQRVNGYLFASSEVDAAKVSEELVAAQRAGAVVTCLNCPPLPITQAAPCLRFEKQAKFHPTKYTSGLSAALRRAGCRIHTSTRVELVQGGSPCRLSIQGGRQVVASAVVIATNTPLNGGALLNARIAAYTTYAVAMEINDDGALNGLFWDTEDPYHYVRTVRHSSGSTLLIVGGEDHKTGQSGDQNDRWRRLIEWTRPRFPSAGLVRNRWSGQVFETLDGLALIGRDPSGAENVYIVTGDSGMGLTHGTIAGLLITDMIGGQHNAWKDLYDPGRLPMGAAGTLIAENSNVAARLVDWVTPGRILAPEDLGRGQGGLMRQGLRKIALYRDAEGTLHPLSAVCPHYGCIVQWNGAESTWDCPCHGSRFSAQGKLLHGPASSDLGAATLTDQSPAEDPRE